MYLVYEKNNFGENIDCVDESEMRLFSTMEKALAEMRLRKNSYMMIEGNTFVEKESDDFDYVFSVKDEDINGKLHICVANIDVDADECCPCCSCGTLIEDGNDC